MKKKKEQPLFFNTWNFKPIHAKYPKGSMKTETIQDQAYTVDQLIRRFEQGIIDPVGVNMVDFDTDDFDSPDLMEINRMDIGEKHEFTTEHVLNTKSKKDQLEKDIQEKRDQQIRQEAEKLAKATAEKAED